MARLTLQNPREMTEHLKNSGFNVRQTRGLMRAAKDALSELDLPTRKDWDKLDQRTQKLYDGFENFRKTFHARLEKALADAQKDIKKAVKDDVKEAVKKGIEARDKNAEKLNDERYSHLLREIEAIRDTAKDLRERWIRDMDALRGDVQRSADESKERDNESKKRDEESKKRDEKLEKESKERDEKLSGDINTLRGEVQRVADESKERDEKLEKGIADARGDAQKIADESKERDEKIENRNERRHDQLLREMSLTREILQAQHERGTDRWILFWGRWLLRRFKILRNLWAYIKS